MADYFITGVSSGIGRKLVKRLIGDGHRVIGIARREALLKRLSDELHNKKSFNYIPLDITKNTSWDKVEKFLRKKKLIPDVVIFNAAIYKTDLTDNCLDYSLTRKIFETNYFSILKGFEIMTKIVKKNSQFIFVSSSSALKGSGAEGVGYPSSKAAISIAFESLLQKYRKIFRLKIVFFGPVKTEMLPSLSKFTPVLSVETATDIIINAVKSKKVFQYHPRLLFFSLRILRLLPETIYLTTLSLIDILHVRSKVKK